MMSLRTLIALSLALALVFLCWSSGSRAGTTQTINETAVGPPEIGYVEAAITGHSQPLKHGTIFISLASLGEALPLTTECSAEQGCGFVAPVKTGFTQNSCNPPANDSQHENFAFTLSGTFCQQPNGAWSYNGSFTVTSSNGNPAAGTGTVEAAGGLNGQSIIALSGVLVQ